MVSFWYSLKYIQTNDFEGVKHKHLFYALSLYLLNREIQGPFWQCALLLT